MANYKWEILQTETMEWKASTGQVLKIELNLRQELIEYLPNNQWHKPKDGLSIEVKGYIDGKQSGIHDWVRNVENHPIMVARLSQVGLNQEKFEEYNKLRAKLESHAAWGKKITEELTPLSKDDLKKLKENAWVEFVNSEGFAEDGTEYENFEEWLNHNKPKLPRDITALD